MRKIMILTTISLLVLTSISFGQMADKAEIQSVKEDYLGLKPVSKPFSLIDLSKLHFSHSYSFTFFSGGGTSGSVGLYTGSMFYEFSHSLSLDVQLGIAHDPSALFGNNVGTDASFYPAVNLDYHPSNNFRISVGFESHPGFYQSPYVYPYYPYNWRRF
jgi:hypothetical protein